MKSLQILMMGGGFDKQGKYTYSQLDDLINTDGYIPIATTDELTSLSTITTQEMGLNTPWFGNYTTGVSKKYVLIYNLDFSSVGIINSINDFTGIFDGNEVLLTDIACNSAIFAGTTTGSIINIRGNTITNATTPTSSLVELLSVGGVMLNNYISVNYTSTGSSGGMVRTLEGGSVTYCGILSGSVVGASDTGGFLSTMSSGVMMNCFSKASVEGVGARIGGFVGQNDGGLIEKCYATGDVVNSPADVYTGGFCAYNSSGGIINDCYATGNVDSVTSSFVGGFVGRNEGSTVTNSYSIGSVSGGAVGGFCQLNDSTITNCYWDTVASGNATSSGGTGKTTTEMQEGEIHDTAIYVSWDDTIWDAVDDSSYPELINV